MSLTNAYGGEVAPRLSDELQQLMLGAATRFETMRATVRDVSNARLYAGSWGRPWDDEHEETGTRTWRVWYGLPLSPFAELETPDQLRVEKSYDGGEFVALTVRDGSRWWAWSQGELRASHEAPNYDSSGDPWLHLIALRWIFSETVEAAGEQTWLGRRALKLVDDAGTSFLGPDADRATYLIDAERGVLLRAEAFVANEQAALEELSDVAFDDPLDPQLFDGTIFSEAAA